MIPDVLDSLEKPDLFEKFKLQLSRDFELCGFLEYAPNIQSNDLQHIYSEVLKSISQLEKKDSGGLMNLLYRIDLTELQIKQASKKEPERAMQQIMAELIIKRILQKVILKQLYSK
jgi:hypothetical protein